MIGSQTLAAGASAITVSGTVLSLQAGGSSVVVGGSGGTTTEAVSKVLSTGVSSSVGGIIASVGGFGSSAAAGSTGGFNGTTFTGAAAKSRTIGSGVEIWRWGVALCGVLGVVGWL